MKKTIFGLLIVMLSVSCATNPNKAEKINTKLEQKEAISATESVGLNDKGEMVVQRKVRLATYLKELQTEVYQMEALVYGDDQLGRPGLYGVLRDCRDKIRSKKLGGEGKVAPPPKRDIKTRGEDTNITNLLDKVVGGRIGKDEQAQIVAVTDEYFLDRIKRFEKYRDSYSERKEFFSEEVRKCSAEIKEKEPEIVAEAAAAPKTEVGKANDVDLYLCQYVESSASLRDLLNIALQRGWISRATLADNRYVNSSSARDASGYERGSVLKLGAWSLAFDRFLNYGEMMNEGRDAKLEAWMHGNKSQIPDSVKCLSKENGLWNMNRSF